MADLLTTIGGISAILDISRTVADLIKGARGASKDRQELLAEINSTTSTCRTLKDFADMDVGICG